MVLLSNGVSVFNGKEGNLTVFPDPVFSEVNITSLLHRDYILRLSAKIPNQMDLLHYAKFEFVWSASNIISA